ncbi:MAG: hypothetical protein ACRD0E_06695, partial [Acidimicrobiales bacterium]
MTNLTASGLHFEETVEPGSSTWVFLVHGSMDRATGFARVRRHLHETSVVAYDRRGYHRSRTSSRLCDEVGD